MPGTYDPANPANLFKARVQELKEDESRMKDPKEGSFLPEGTNPTFVLQSIEQPLMDFIEKIKTVSTSTQSGTPRLLDESKSKDPQKFNKEAIVTLQDCVSVIEDQLNPSNTLGYKG